MKNTFKFIMAIAIASSSLFFSCETIELELLDNPNALSEGQGDAEFLLNSIQLAYRNNAITFNGNGESLTRIRSFGSRDYFNGLTGGTLNGAWTRTYAGIFPDVQALEQLAEDPTADLRFHIGTAKIMQAHSLLWLVDYIGDVPLSQALNSTEFPSPVVDDGASVYQGALAILDEGIALLSSIEGPNNISPEITDMYYNEDFSLWIKAGNTIKMKAAITTGDIATFNAIVNTGDFIQTADEDLQFQYGTNLLNPNTRHPDYNFDYTDQGNNVYQSNYLMNVMQETNDPRIRYYYFRQSGCTPGASCLPDGNGETLSCSLIDAPVHYNGFVFCNLENGYWGRDHGNDEGAPPDGFSKTAIGVYPAAGKLDVDNFANLIVVEDDGTFSLELNEADDLVSLGGGGVGEGIEPIILSSYVDFWRAEAAMIEGNTGAAAGFIENGLTKSIAKVQAFGLLDQGSVNAVLSADINASTGALSNVVLANSLIPTSADNQAFIDSIVSDFNDEDTEGKFNILAEQYFVTMYGGGAEAYNFYRRQGFPLTLQPNLEPDPGAFPRSFPYTTDEIVANPNISQKPNFNVQVFWDTNPPSAPTGGFPAAN